jgi:hypothetical protein
LREAEEVTSRNKTATTASFVETEVNTSKQSIDQQEEEEEEEEEEEGKNRSKSRSPPLPYL